MKDTIKLKYLCRSYSSNLAASTLLNSGYPVYGAAKLMGYSELPQEMHEYLGIIKDGAGVGRIQKYPAKTSLLGTMAYILPNPDIDIDWLMYVIKSLDLGVSVDKTTIPHIYFSDYGNATVPCVEISVQKKIAAYLNIQNDKINSSIAKQQDIIDALEEYKMALSTHATTKGIDKSNLVDSNESWLGSIPSGWQVRRIGTLFKETNERGNDELPILTVSINDGISSKELSEDESMRNFVRSEDKSKYKRMLPGDIVYNMMRAWQGAFGAARVEGMVSPAYVTARPITPMDSRYFEYLMRTDIAAKEFERYSRGIADFRLRLYWPEFRTIKVCVPPIAEQTRIADFLDEQYEKIAHSIQLHKNIIIKLEEYRKAIIYHTINGNVDMKEVQNG